MHACRPLTPCSWLLMFSFYIECNNSTCHATCTPYRGPRLPSAMLAVSASHPSAHPDMLPSHKNNHRWLEIPDKGKKYSAPFTPQMAADVAAYYFHHYCIHWSYGALGECTRCIPQVMTWDDHDLFDGWGSYPYHIQNCQVRDSLQVCLSVYDLPVCIVEVLCARCMC